MKPHVLNLLLVLPFSGCTHLIGPDHTVPQMALPDRWSSASAHGNTVTPKWWRLFGDAELSRLEELALQANQDLATAMHRVDEAQADFRTQRADLYPNTSVGAATDRSQSSANATQLPGFTPPEVAQYRLKSSFAYELDLWGKVRRQLESSRASLAATAYARDAVMLRLTGEVAEQYLALRTLEAEKALLEQAIELRQQSLELTQKKFEGGFTSQSDVTRARSSLASAEADVADITRRRELAENTLSQLCGQPTSDFYIRPSSRLPSRVTTVISGKPASLLKQRPDIAESERTLAARSADIGVAMGQRLPSLKLNGSLNLESLSLGDLLTSGSRAFSLGPELSLPIFSGGSNVARIAKARAKYQQAAASYRGTVLASIKEVEDALTNQRGYHTLAEKHQANADAAAETVRLSLERYTQGRVNYLEVVDAQREQLLAQRALIQAQGQGLQASVQLMRALGGGWNADASPR